jgi:mRNA-degrading endonuclease YafQ of YafQ-DinJ toxin-antitoxin module
MTFEVYSTQRFDRNLRRFIRRQPHLRERVEDIITQLADDPFHPELRLHALRGRLEGYHSASVDYSNRIVMVLEARERRITLVAIGTHDEVYR